MLPAVTITSRYLCPMMTPNVVPIPHTGGMVNPNGNMVLFGNLPAARLGDQTLCQGPPPHPDMIAKGATSVLIGKMPAARLSDTTAGMQGTMIQGAMNIILGN